MPWPLSSPPTLCRPAEAGTSRALLSRKRPNKICYANDNSIADVSVLKPKFHLPARLQFTVDPALVDTNAIGKPTSAAECRSQENRVRRSDVDLLGDLDADACLSPGNVQQEREAKKDYK